MDFLEKDLERIIMENDNYDLWECGLPIRGIKRSQVSIGNYGISDIITYRHETEQINGKFFHHQFIQVFELKNLLIDMNTFLQGVRYVKGIQEYISKTGREKSLFHWELILIGRKVNTNSDFIYLPDLFPTPRIGNLNLKFFTYKFSLDGLLFHEIENYSLIDSGF